jgi:pimeloyl-ACP methyl ester carboxylesterase
MARNPTFVLVHGSCHGGWCWKKLRPILEADGYKVHTPTLTGLGERSHLVQEKTDLNTHIQDIVQEFIYEDLRETILVGHSYGGMVIGGVAEIIPEKIKHLVYLDAYIPEDNKSGFDLVPGLIDIYKKRTLKEQGKEWLVASYDPEDWGVTDSNDIEWMKSRLNPMPWYTHDQRLRIQNIQSKKLEKSYISCTEFGDLFLNRIRQKDNWHFYECKTGHDSMITSPKELSQILAKIASL